MSVYILAAVTVVAFYIVFKDEKDKYDAYRAFERNAGNKLRVVKCNSTWILYMCGFTVLLIALAVFAYLNPDSAGTQDQATFYLVLMISMIAAFVGYVVLESKFQNLHINRESFFNDGKTYRFSSVRGMEKRYLGYRVTTFTGDTFNVSGQKGKAIAAEMSQLKKKK